MRTIAVVGGGAGGVEILLAMQWRLASQLGPAAPRFILVTDTPQLLPNHSPAVRRRVAAKLVQREVVLKTRSAVAEVEPGALVTTAGARIATDRIVWATAAAPQRWLARRRARLRRARFRPRRRPPAIALAPFRVRER